MSRNIRDAIWCVAFVVIASILLSQTDAVETWVRVTRPIEAWELDEVPVVIFAVLLAATWYAYRRLQDSRREVVRRQEIEGDLIESQALTRQVIDAVPALVAYIDRDLCYQLNNRRYEAWYGLSREAIRGQAVASIMHPTSFEAVRPLMERALRGETVESVDQLRNWGGEERFAQINYLPRIDEDGVVHGFFVHVMDVTARKRAEIALQVAKEEAEAANAAKSRFLAAASHDLRQPLHAVRLLVEAMKMERDRERQIEILGNVRAGIESMGGMLNALLDVSEIESGAIKPQHQDIELAPILENLAARAASRSEAGGLTFRFVPCSGRVHSDPKLLERIVENFLDNALRYTHEGRILLGCRRRGDRLRIEVWDSGIGIPGDALKLIFEEYYQLDNPSRDRTKGLGLGLALVKRLANLLGHEIDVRSMPGKGSLFAVDLPLASAAAETPEAASDSGKIRDIAGQRILLVEDDENVAEAARQLLLYWGLEVHVATTGDAALVLIRDRLVYPNLVIADYRLPQGESGLDLVQRIRDMLDDPLPAVVVTGDTSAGLADKVAARDCALLHKPVKPDVLRFLLCDLLAGSVPNRAPTPAPASRQN